MRKAPRKEFLTDELVEQLHPEPLQYYVWDKKTCGFGVRIGSSGCKSFVGKINHANRTSKWHTLWSKTTEEARAEYSRLMASDPQVVNSWRGDIGDRFPRRGKRPAA